MNWSGWQELMLARTNLRQSFLVRHRVDVLRIRGVPRKLLKARDVYLDALWEVRQAQSDLAAAVGDPFFADSTGENATATKSQTPLAMKP
jgi:hypothetical protein